jgi:AcrR family transcriptional regulator
MKPRDPQKIDRIHSAALELVSEIGLAGLTMSKIGKKAKLGMGTIYTYFESKEEIINSLYQQLKQKHSNAVYANFDETQPYTLRFQTIFNAFIRHYYHHEEEYFFFEQCKGSIFLSPDSIIMEEAAFARMFNLLDEGKKLGLVKDTDNHLLIGYMSGGIQGFIAQLRRQKQTLTQELIDLAFELCCNSIRD